MSLAPAAGMPTRGERRKSLRQSIGSGQRAAPHIPLRDLHRLDNQRVNLRGKAKGLRMDRVAVVSQFDRKLLKMLADATSVGLENSFLAGPDFIKGRNQH